ncbi:MAG: outer membrane beta-barrel protein [Pseudomonadota bacterium]
MKFDYFNSRLFLMVLLLATQSVGAETNNPWYVKPYIGLSQLSNTTADSSNIGSADGRADIDTESGFVSGISLGYQFNENIATEFGWEYRSNDSEVTLADGQIYSDGNYASNLFYVNGVYAFAPSTPWNPYLGVGV